MRTTYWLSLLTFIIEISLLLQPAECFFDLVQVSAPTALAIIATLMKIKAVIVKILLGLKLMGVEGFVVRRKKRSAFRVETEEMRQLQTELFSLWNSVQNSVDSHIDLDVNSCIRSSRLVKSNQGDNRHLYLLGREGKTLYFKDGKTLSSWISAVLGSMLPEPGTCKQLYYGLKKRKFLYLKSSLSLQNSIGILR